MLVLQVCKQKLALCSLCMQRAFSCQLGLFLLRQSTFVSSFNRVVILAQLMWLTQCIDKRKAPGNQNGPESVDTFL
jgi:hypothetical protein